MNSSIESLILSFVLIADVCPEECFGESECACGSLHSDAVCKMSIWTQYNDLVPQRIRNKLDMFYTTAVSSFLFIYCVYYCHFYKGDKGCVWVWVGVWEGGGEGRNVCDFPVSSFDDKALPK